MIREYIIRASSFRFGDALPWSVISNLCDTIERELEQLDDNYVITDGVAVHKTATVAQDATIKAPAIICAGCFVGAHSFLRGGVYLAPGARVGVSCEVKSSVLLEDCAVAHFNYVGDSIIGHNVNIEAGAILANHYNERDDDTVYVRVDDNRISTGLRKFGALVGDDCRIGANAVLSPGTLLKPHTIVKRLQLVEQDPLE